MSTVESTSVESAFSTPSFLGVDARRNSPPQFTAMTTQLVLSSLGRTLCMVPRTRTNIPSFCPLRSSASPAGSGFGAWPCPILTMLVYHASTMPE